MKTQYTERQLIDLGLNQLKDLLYNIPFVKYIEARSDIINSPSDFEVMVYLSNEKEPITIYGEMKTRGERRFAEEFIQDSSPFKSELPSWLLMAPYISPQTAELLKKNGYSYMDLSGNCYIAVETIYVSVEGKPNLYKEHEYDRNFFSKKASVASAILRTMLNDPYTPMRLKTIAEKTGKSIGAVYNVKTYLEDHGWAEMTEGGLSLCNTDEMLKAWAQEYRKIPNRFISVYSFDDIFKLEEKVQQWNTRHYKAVLGFFSAAARYAPVVRYNKIHVYMPQEAVNHFMTDLQLKEVPRGENMRILIPYDETICMFSKRKDNSLITSPVQTVLDLLSGIGRGEEAAEAIMNKEIISNG